MSKQLRLLTKGDTPPVRARATTRTTGRARRAAHWQTQWRLDDHTRAVGRAGVASARRALERAERSEADTTLRRAS